MSAKHRTTKPRPFSDPPPQRAGWGAWIAVLVLAVEVGVCAYALATR